MKGSLQIKNNKYYAVFRVKGKQKWVCLNIPTTRGNKRKAEKALQRVLSEYSENENNINDMLFVDYLDMWLAQVQYLVKPSTYEGYRKVINGKVKPYFQDKRFKLRDLRGMHFTEYFILYCFSINVCKHYFEIKRARIKKYLYEHIGKDNDK